MRHVDAGDVHVLLDDGVELGRPRRGDGGDELPRRDLGEEDARHAVQATRHSAVVKLGRRHAQELSTSILVLERI